MDKLAREAGYRARELAKVCGLSTRQLQRRFKLALGRTPQDWLDELRMKTAEDMLLQGCSVKCAALETGFRQVSHFCRCFKAKHHVTASQFVLLVHPYVPMSLGDNRCRC